jgi:hypothetical protein
MLSRRGQRIDSLMESSFTLDIKVAGHGHWTGSPVCDVDLKVLIEHLEAAASPEGQDVLYG